jgi:hypothetical protein
VRTAMVMGPSTRAFALAQDDRIVFLTGDAKSQ